MEYIGTGTIKKATILSDQMNIHTGDPLRIKVYFQQENLIQNLVLGIVIKDQYDNAVIGVNNKHYYSNKLHQMPLNSGELQINIPALYVMPGEYKVDLLGDSVVDVDVVENALHFNVEESNINNTATSLDFKINKIFIKNITWHLSNESSKS